jgi:iron complex outermembrane receptor protein
MGASGAVTYASENVDALLAFSIDQLDRSGLTIEKTFAAQDPRLPTYEQYFARQSQNDTTNPATAFGQVAYLTEGLGTFRTQGGLQQLDSGAEFQLSSAFTHNSRVSLRNWFVSVGHENEWSQFLTTDGWIQWSQGEPTKREQIYPTETLFDPVDAPPLYRRRFRYRAIDARFQARLSPLRGLSVRVGGDYSIEFQRLFYYRRVEQNNSMGVIGEETDEVRPSDILKADFSNIGVDGELSFRLGQSARITGNVRFDKPGDVKPDGMPSLPLYDEQLSFRVAVASKLGGNLSAKLVAGQAFQIPSAVLLFAIPSQAFGADNIIGNRTPPATRPDINPQSVRSAEAQLSMLAGPALIEVSAYGQEIQDRLAFVKIGANYEAVNLEDTQRSVGGELTGLLSLRSFFPYARLGVHRLVSGGDDLNSTTPYPEIIGALGADFRFAEVPIAVNGEVVHYRDRGSSLTNAYFNNNIPYTLDPYTEVNLTVLTRGFYLPGETIETRMVVSARNIFDSRHSEPGFAGFDLPSPGRRILLEVRQAF